MVKQTWHALAARNVLKQLGSSTEGLTDAEVQRRLKRYGKNHLAEYAPEHPVRLFVRQFRSPLIAILIIAAILSILLREMLDAAIIVGILLFNATIGFVQERRADTALRALQQLVQVQAMVVRDGKVQTIEHEHLVPGDILVVETGDILPCDARIFEHTNLSVDESILTGEANPVRKMTRKLAVKTALPDRLNMLFRGTTVVYGRGRAVVTATGMHTHYGSIVQEVQRGERRDSPLQHRFKRLSQSIGIAVLGVALLVVLLGTLRDLQLTQMILVGLSLAVSVIPEGLPIVVTVTLAIGMWRMARRKAIVRKLPAVETLGSVNLIASDKTGTLTHGEMMVQRIVVDDKEYSVTGEGYRRQGTFTQQKKEVHAPKERGLIFALRIGALCNNAAISFPEEEGEERPKAVGDPTEIALLVAAVKAGLEPKDLVERYPRIGEIPFDTARKYMVTMHRSGNREFIAVKGAPERILDMCRSVRVNGRTRRLTRKAREILKLQYRQMAHASLRGIAVAYWETRTSIKDAARISKEKHLTFAGLLGIRDSVREEVARTVAVAQQAGIGVMMITGDHQDTAVAIAKELGIMEARTKRDEADAVIDGCTLDELSDEELKSRLPKLRVAARVSPEHKLRIVRLAKELGSVVAVTGDGVNDAPALVEGDIGIAVDQKSTDAAKSASDILLTDGNFDTMIAAVEEGRTIFANIRRVTLYLLSTNAVEAVIIILALSFALPLPLLPIQILWLNVVTDTFLDVSIGTEPKHATIMQGKPNARNERILNLGTLGRFLFLAAIMIGIVFFVYRFALAHTLDLRYVYAMTLTALAVTQWFNSFNVRSGRASLFNVGIFKNRFHLLALAIVLCLHLTVLYVPALTKALHLVPLGPKDWLMIVGLGVIVFVLEEFRKFVFRHWRRQPKDVHTPEPAVQSPR